MDFKKLRERDLNSVFFNKNELAEEVVFAGQNLTVIKSSEEFKKKYKGREEETGIYSGGVTFSVKKIDLPILMSVGEKITIDSIRYEVIDIDIKEYTYKIDLITHMG